MELGLLFERAQFYYEAGGYVMPWLVLATLVLWFGLGYRAAVLRRGGNISVRVVLRREIEGRGGKARGIIEQAARDGLAVARSGGAHLRRRLDDALADHFMEIKRYRKLVGAIVAVAPVLGLLGTVTGMMETFRSLDDAALYTRNGGIAAGISQALFTTQLGLAVAIPGLVIKGFLDRKQRVIEMELAQIKDILSSRELAVSADGGEQ
ncbi:MotA/TolQ/ExbB proton channel family protein [Spectribacter hydrogenoxidans]|uniref:MotA/TolQ/ExbB proton channel family protein n=1 Tax=Spectribacter hydrogenoxidans TaxID=3075608 RepID=A0ABU3BYK1_9GAMM|nr:MotA/TolQ/ExbB proton channel family protein [Salinisphaera sp. W335]MDT0634345.1 MotA/TolQ/ExbB proton channel family protein [Salinisphaera sp. W335]